MLASVLILTLNDANLIAEVRKGGDFLQSYWEKIIS